VKLWIMMRSFVETKQVRSVLMHGTNELTCLEGRRRIRPATCSILQAQPEYYLAG
jgi:hypothetical protein